MRMTAVVGMALSLGLVSGCSGGTGPDAKAGGETRKGGESAPPAPKGPVYKGAPVPGLATQQAWSLPADDATTCAGDASKGDKSERSICALGDAVVVTGARSGDSGTSSFTAQLLDAKSGELRKKFDFEIPAQNGSTQYRAEQLVQVSEWRDGSPALLIRTRIDTPAKDLKKASTQTVLTMYAPSGDELGSSTFDGETRLATPVRGGYVVDTGAAGGNAKFIPIGDGETLTPTFSYLESQGEVGPGLGYSWITDVSYQPSARWLIATDIRSGKRAWSTKDLAPPAAIAKLVTEKSATTARMTSLHGDKAVLEWSAFGKSEAVLTSIDLKTGRRIAEGPGIDATVTSDDDGHAVSPDGKTAVVQYGKGAVAWNTETGQELWSQAKDEQNIKPRALPGNGVLYAELEGGNAVALDVRNKKLLAAEIEELPQFTANGYAIVRSADGFFVFATQTV
ncbi:MULTISPECIES: PQQ-binding-like beta-propeller repeat protein [unclassified Streptomyces]|uniref:outer membrane protein assembly factor BamB family protein n=1 Tax=unclassified Streptomyces TaxID=2593676 RepID=UPI001BE967F9|nr:MULTISPECIES: PQQ-binding-like beta-propeller repeat protein [unclassified Streptomyces]MBT2407000.1 PQQ-binding-like beta-propeller repeat protein [Streptomyces sp. ISL-21]MBT2613252.1 PQQ-binding-like beta-propeller repeat protein [Streptomyces sp. ISL-87]